jgi:hypothetical protein
LLYAPIYLCNGHIEEGRHIDWQYVTGAHNITFRDCRFVDCRATSTGGAVQCDEPISDVYFHTCTFNKCRCLEDGGALFLSVHSLLLSANCFQLCRCGNQDGNRGSAISAVAKSSITTSFLSALRCPKSGDPSWLGIAVLTSEFLSSANINLSHSHTQFVTGLVHRQAGEDTSFLRYYLSMSQIEGNPIGFSEFHSPGGHLFGALVNDSTTTGLVYLDNANTTLGRYFFLGNIGQITYSACGESRVDFVDCVFSFEKENEGKGFGTAVGCRWNAKQATPIPMKLLKTAFCEGNWGPGKPPGWRSWMREEWVELVLVLSPFLGVAAVVVVWGCGVKEGTRGMSRRR